MFFFLYGNFNLYLWLVQWFYVLEYPFAWISFFYIQDPKIIGLIKGKGKGIDPETVIVNFSSSDEKF